MTLNRNRVLSGSLAASYILIVFCARGAEAGFKAALFVVLPLGCIWFADAMGGYIGPNWRGSITGPTPGIVVCIGGWLLLLLPVIIGLVYALTGS